MSTTGSKIADFIDTHIVCRFGIPHRILIDNGTCFKNHHVKALCNRYQIQHSFSTPYYPQGNGQPKATNKTIISILNKIVIKNHRDWHEHLPYALWAYRTSIRVPTGATPFSLVYGAEAVMPLELEIPSLRVQLQGLIPDEDIKQARLNQLDLLDEHRVNAIQHHKVYQEWLKNVYGSKVRPREFEVGDLVLK